MKNIKITNRYRKQAEKYKYHARSWKHILDFSEDALQKCFMWETHGKEYNPNNGYMVGKGWLDVNTTMIKEDTDWLAKTMIEIFQQKHNIVISSNEAKSFAENVMKNELAEEDETEKDLLK
jgi:hypothetical protein